MITNKEMFCTLFGALTMIDKISDQNKGKLIRTAGENFGLNSEEMKEIISDLDKTIAYILSTLIEKNKNYK
jgi:hypothetical protein